MSNPILVEVLRSSLVESRHRGAAAVADADGATVLAIGDTKRVSLARFVRPTLRNWNGFEIGAVRAMEALT
jgi:L-asparaginase II